MSNSTILNARYIIKSLIVIVLLSNISYGMMRFISKDELVDVSKHIVLAKIISATDTGRIVQERGIDAMLIENKLKVVELLKGSLSLDKPFIINTFNFDGWMEDNVQLPPVGSKVLLFLREDKNGELMPTNGIQGVWPISHDEELAGAGSKTKLNQIREMIHKQTGTCKEPEKIDKSDIDKKSKIIDKIDNKIKEYNRSIK
ncbi:hypothetical protein MNB_SV-6-1711 [hydrothermal vent metagenome]|uniref:Uncharacterized protein n=1 Tax=hydrothermal vent metagenome TaxID=652676 RepID=A0A1W1C5G9_9ZZZZ